MILLHVSMPFSTLILSFLFTDVISVYIYVCVCIPDIKDYLPSKHKVTDIKKHNKKCRI